MDLSFSRMQERKLAGATPLLAFDLPILLAASAAWQADSPTARAITSVHYGQAGMNDRVHALAGLFAPGQDGAFDISCLAGSFNVLISEHLMVGQ